MVRRLDDPVSIEKDQQLFAVAMHSDDVVGGLAEHVRRRRLDARTDDVYELTHFIDKQGDRAAVGLGDEESRAFSHSTHRKQDSHS